MHVASSFSLRYCEMPRVIRAPADASKRPRGTIGQYFATKHCPICESLTLEGICQQCKSDPQKVAVSLSVRMREREIASTSVKEVSSLVCGIPFTILVRTPLDSPFHHSLTDLF